VPGNQGLLSRSDPTPDTTHNRPRILLVIVLVALVSAVVALHLTGVVRPGSH
jgi:hypothetical protein